MEREWCLIEDILSGGDTVRRRREHYLPKYEAENDQEYHRRLHCAELSPNFGDGRDQAATA